MEGQLSIFDIAKDNSYDMLLNQLSVYGIDEYYEENIKGKGWLLNAISEQLNELPRYKEYKTKLLELLTKHFEKSDVVEIIYYADADYIRINEPRKSYPLYCLAMINKDIL